jgi:hypothetical protein
VWRNCYSQIQDDPATEVNYYNWPAGNTTTDFSVTLVSACFGFVQFSYTEVYQLVTARTKQLEQCRTDFNEILPWLTVRRKIGGSTLF